MGDVSRFEDKSPIITHDVEKELQSSHLADPAREPSTISNGSTVAGDKSAAKDDEVTPSGNARQDAPPPDGGLQAWLQVLATHLTVFNTWGIINSFGIFQGTYLQQLQVPASTISWIGSIQIFLIFFVGVFSGRLLDRGYLRTILLAGGALQLIGIFTASAASHSYWQLFLAQGLCQGLGFGLYFCPMIALLATYFDRRRTFALAVGASGGGTGGIVFPIIAEQLLPKVGFPWTMRIMGFVALFNIIIIIAVARTRVAPRQSGPLVEWAAFQEPKYVLFAIGAFFTLWGTFFAYYYVRVYALQILAADQQTSYMLLLLLNAIGIPGRIVPAFIADRWVKGGTVIVFVPCVLFASITLYLWSEVHNLAENWVWVVFFGFFGASIQGLFPASLASLSPHPSKNGTRIGMTFSIVSIACLTGPPLAGKLIQIDGGSYLAAQMWGGTVLLVGAAVCSGSVAALLKERRQARAAAQVAKS